MIRHAIVLIFLLPFIGGAATSILRGNAQARTGMAAALATVGATGLLAGYLIDLGPQTYLVGGWVAPLGINLRADGLSLLMVGLTTVIGFFVSIYSLGYFAGSGKEPEGPGLFWPLWLFLWGGLNALFVVGDLFTIYLLLEYTLMASVALAALGGSKAGHVSALRYLLAATGAALFYLLGVALLYSETRTLDLHLLREQAPDGFIPMLALGLMVGGLMLKSALFPLHFWLPPAHSTAPAPVSAVLSALVVKAGFYVILRLWFEVYPSSALVEAGHVLAGFGGIAVVWGAWRAIRQERLKMLIAYSTVSQIGYLFLLFPLAIGHGPKVMTAITYQILSHGLAKAAMFMGAGALLKSAHSDLITRTRGTARKAPLAVAAMIVSGAALAGAAPGGGSKGKLLEITHSSGQWWWSAVIVGGMVLAGVYTFVAVRHSFLPAAEEGPQRAAPALETAALILAIAAVALSFGSSQILALLKISDR